MTRILVFLSNRSVLLTESPLSPHQLVTAVNSADMTGLPPEIGQFPVKGDPAAFQCDELVVITGWHGPREQSGSLREPPNLPAGEPGSPLLPRLTARENAVFQGLAQGLTVKEIAFRFGIRPRTVREHVLHINEKFDAQTTEQAVGRGVLLGLCRSFSPPDR